MCVYIDNELILYVLYLLLVVITVSVGSDRFPIPPFVPFHYSSVDFFFFFEIGLLMLMLVVLLLLLLLLYQIQYDDDQFE